MSQLLETHPLAEALAILDKMRRVRAWTARSPLQNEMVLFAAQRKLMRDNHRVPTFGRGEFDNGEP
jgi:hypothetical protein